MPLPHPQHAIALRSYKRYYFENFKFKNYSIALMLFTSTKKIKFSTAHCLQNDDRITLAHQ